MTPAPQLDGPLHALVLAAGKGTRMKSDLPKVLHRLAGRPLYAWVLAAVEALKPESECLLVGPEWPSSAALTKGVESLVQQERKGTGHALKVAAPYLQDKNGWLLMAYGDTPLVRPSALQAMIRSVMDQQADLAVTGFEPTDPTGYGRLLVESDGTLVRIVEHKDATEAERKVRLCNGGLMLMRMPQLLSWLEDLSDDNAAGEFYATDLVAIARKRGFKPVAVSVPEEDIQGVNTRAELAQAEAHMQARLRAAVMAGGATLIDPSSVTLNYDTQLGSDVIVEPNQFFGPGVSVASGTRLKAYGHYEDVVIGEDCEVGPYARLRPGTRLAKGVKIGNFVEVKKAHLDTGAKVNHLSYVGDAFVGAAANVGAGTITCNYDGFNKHVTHIGAGAFIGSNTALVAPLTVGEGAIVGAGSTLTQDVEADALALTRAPQTEKEGWAQRFRRAVLARKQGN